MTIFGKILLGLILVTGAVLIIKGGPKDEVVVEDTIDAQAVVAEETPADDGAFKGSAKALMARGGDHKCTFTQVVENSTSTGTVYISGMKMRGDFKSDVSAAGTNISVESHMISDGEFTWVWSSMMPTGMKMKIDAEAGATADQGFDANQELEYSCVKWNRDASQFDLPSAVTFTEIKAS